MSLPIEHHFNTADITIDKLLSIEVKVSRPHRKPAGPPVPASSALWFGDSPVLEWSYPKSHIIGSVLAGLTGTAALVLIIVAATLR